MYKIEWKEIYTIQLLSGKNWSHQLCIWIHARRCVYTVCFEFHVQLIRHFLSNTATWIQLIAQHMSGLHIFSCKNFHVLWCIVWWWMISLVCGHHIGRWRTWRWIFNISSCYWSRFVCIRLCFVWNFQFRKWSIVWGAVEFSISESFFVIRRKMNGVGKRLLTCSFGSSWHHRWSFATFLYCFYRLV